jgi:hypothetical protein
MKLNKLPWIRTGVILAVAGFAYHSCTKEPTVYEPMPVTQVYAGVDTLDGHNLRISGVPSPASYSMISKEKAALSFVLSDNNGSHITCYSEGRVNDGNVYLQVKALLDHVASKSDSTIISLEGKMKNDFFEFKLPKKLDDIIIN